METRQGVAYQWSTKRIRLYEKSIELISRDIQTKRLVREIIAGQSTPQARLLTILIWVDEHVRPSPEGFPLVDDHVLNVILRFRYGAPDQRPEAFALLATYA